MSTRYNTGNPIESTDVRDMSDNAQNLDLFSTSSEDLFIDRLGVSRKTLTGAVKDIGIPIVGDFTTGCTVTSVNQGVQEIGGSVYRWKGALPKVVPPSSTPDGTGGISPSGNWVNVGDASAYSRITDDLLAGCLVKRTGKYSLRDIVSVVDFGASGGATDDTSAFQSAVASGGGVAFVPYNPNGYTVNAHVYGLVGYGATKFKGTGLVSYTDLSKSNGEYLTCANIAKQLSDGQNITIACTGDSTMYGYLVGGSTAQTQDPNNPPLSLKRTLSHVYGGYTGTVINAAVSGNNMDDLMKTVPSFESRVATGDLSTASVIYCNHAINNCQSNLSINEFKQNYFDFVSIVRRYGKVPVMVTPNPINPLFGGDKRESTQVDMYAQVMRDVAEQTGCDIVDNYYWTKQTALRYTETVIVPDGVHPSTDLYKQLGRNLAIPLVSANTLRKEGDVASLSGSSYLDTAYSVIQRQDQTRTGLAFVSSRAATPTGINCAVILEEPFKFLSFMALQWESGARVQVGVQDNTTPWAFPRFGKDTGSIGTYTWDTEFTAKTDAMAGLNIVYVIYDQTDTRPTNNAIALSGFSVPISGLFSAIAPDVYAGESVGSDYLNRAYVSSRRYVRTVYEFSAGGAGFEAKDKDMQYVFKLYLNATNELRFDFYNSISGLTSSTLLAGGEPAGKKIITIFVFDDKLKIAVNRLGTATAFTQTISLTNNITPFMVNNPGLQFSVCSF